MTPNDLRDTRFRRRPHRYPVAMALFAAAFCTPGARAGDVTISLEMGGGDGQLQVDATGTPGNLFRIERSGDLVNWEEALFAESESGQVQHGEPDGSGPLYFRAVSGPKPSAAGETYNGWEDSIRITNGTVEAVIVPSIARIMQFSFVGAQGRFWENNREFGRPPSTSSWRNFGGDKVWPSPQSDFPIFTGRGWPPPSGFDASAFDAEISPGGDTVTLTNTDSSQYGVKITREIKLLPLDPVMEVTTTYERTDLLADDLHLREISVWVVTQVDDVEEMFLPVPEPSIWGDTGFTVMTGGPIAPANADTIDGFIRLTRRANTSYKIGSDAGEILAVYPEQMLLMESPRVPGATYAPTEDESSTQVFSNGSRTTPYLEMEFQSPWVAIPSVGDEVSATVRYTLLRRRDGTSPLDEAKRVFGQP